MSRREDTTSRRRLVDRLVPGTADGPLVAMLATTFDFQPDFFETDLLPSVLGLGAWDDRSWASRIAIERDLANVEAACVLFDARRYQGRPRSLRVEVQPVVAVRGASFHPKIILAVHENLVRLVVGSANLTEQGFRKNREVVAIVSVTREQPEYGAVVGTALDGLVELLDRRWTPSAHTAAVAATRRIEEWTRSGPRQQQTWFVWGGTITPLWRQVLDRWPAAEQVNRITIVSPFWSEEDGGGPLDLFLGKLRERDALARHSEVRLLADANPTGENDFRPRLPRSYETLDLRPLGVRTVAHAVDPRPLLEEVSGQEGFLGLRALHAKVVRLEGERCSLAYLGSANFTHHGWGFLDDPKKANIEAGLVLLRWGEERRALDDLVPPTVGKPVELGKGGAVQLAAPAPTEASAPWPEFLVGVRLAPCQDAGDRLVLTAELDTALLAGEWSVRLDDGNDPEGELMRGTAGDLTDFQTCPLSGAVLERLLVEQQVLVRWWDSPAGRWYPLNVSVEARDALPIAPGSGGPNEAGLLAYYQGRISFADLYPEPTPADTTGSGFLTPASGPGVDTSRIQSYQIREFVEALRGIRDDLREAAASAPSMRLAVLGPVSPVALGRLVLDAVRARSRTPTAAAFQLLEILCCLADARGAAEGKTHRDAWLGLLNRAVEEIEGLLRKLHDEYASDLAENRALAAYERAVRKQFELQGGRP